MSVDRLERAYERSGGDPSLLTPFVPSTKEPIYQVCVAVSAAKPTWRVLRSLVDDSGFWPVILGTEAEADSMRKDLLYQWERESSPRGRHAETQLPRLSLLTPAEAIVRHALALDPAVWIKERTRRDSQYYEPPRGNWPSEPALVRRFYGRYDEESKHGNGRAVIALVPTTSSWEVPAYLRWGGWNECPDAAAHVCMLRYWHSRYGSDLVGLGPDTMELHVLTPPHEKREAVQLAFEQFVYCADIVLQGTQTVDMLAAVLLGAHRWGFWWD